MAPLGASGTTVYSAETVWEVQTISSYSFSMRGFKGVATLSEPLLSESFWSLLLRGTGATVMAGGRGGNIVNSVPLPPDCAVLSNPLRNSFPVEDSGDVCVMSREVLSSGGR